MKRVTLIALMFASLCTMGIDRQQPGPARGAVFVAYYWRAKPGMLDAYNDYIKTVAEPIDEDARRAGVFEEVRTVMPASGITTDWTHLRVFRLKDASAAENLSAGLDAATARVVPDEARRKANSERASSARPCIRRNIRLYLTCRGAPPPLADALALWCSGVSRTERRLLSDNLHHDLALARTRVELEQHDLLPRAEEQLMVRERHGERWSEQRGADVTRSVVVAPSEMMTILIVARRDLLEEAIQIRNRARLELDGRHRGGRADDEDRDEAGGAG